MVLPGPPLQVLKATLYTACVGYVLIGALAPFTVDPSGSVAEAATRQILIYFAVAALAVMLFPTVRLRVIGLKLTGLAMVVEVLHALAANGHPPHPFAVVAAAGGLAIALSAAWIGRSGRVQRGHSPPSAAFLL